MINLKCLKPGCDYATNYSREAINHVEDGFDAGDGTSHVMEGENPDNGTIVTISLTED